MWEQWDLEWREWETAPGDWVGCRRGLWSSSIVSGRSQRRSDCEITQLSPVVPLSRCISVTFAISLVRKRNRARCRRTDREQDAQICSAWSPLLPARHGTWHSYDWHVLWGHSQPTVAVWMMRGGRCAGEGQQTAESQPGPVGSLPQVRGRPTCSARPSQPACSHAFRVSSDAQENWPYQFIALQSFDTSRSQLVQQPHILCVK